MVPGTGRSEEIRTAVDGLKVPRPAGKRVKAASADGVAGHRRCHACVPVPATPARPDTPASSLGRAVHSLPDRSAPGEGGAGLIPCTSGSARPGLLQAEVSELSRARTGWSTLDPEAARAGRR